MKVHDIFVKQRGYDNLYMLLGKVLDYNNSYYHKNEADKYTTFVPYMWIILDVKSTEDQLGIN